MFSLSEFSLAFGDSSEEAWGVGEPCILGFSVADVEGFF
jgi:hypothetical protein